MGGNWRRSLQPVSQEKLGIVFTNSCMNGEKLGEETGYGRAPLEDMVEEESEQAKSGREEI